MANKQNTIEQLTAKLAEAENRVAELEEVVAQQQQTEQELRESDTFLRSLFDSMPQNVISKDTEGRLTFVNKSYCQLTGRTAEEYLGKDEFAFYPPDLANKYREDDRQVMESGQLFETTEVHQQVDGEKNYVYVVKTPVYDTTGEVSGIFIIFWDVTAQVQAEEEQKRLQQKVIESQQVAIQELSTPVIPIMDRIIVMPMVGSIDSMRARDITRSLLEGIGKHRAKIVILDVTGVSLMDTGIVNHLNKTIQAAKLKGAQTIVTGISDAVAESMVDLAIDWSHVTTLSDLQTGLVIAFKNLGIQLSKQ